ncbi:ABC-type nitrate/sulfonate/bicarbonate transport system permease component [Micromonospora kangleipakensis]|uniref:ABC-type nitrate/sulfonate/bicarbonate transport system permease component n=1 Tax=Micromonospora kangleipakensis TaxID=1077942 RepID=A0A4Q8BFI2_9ACTN|nr:ABC transporter permease subunit [Micromonospora kangleipakensis]RZU76023.1 ABC-type nitrate/sulfonate/bicarbonate transport system permease component [Micromonospora kangleipakensis]
MNLNVPVRASSPFAAVPAWLRRALPGAAGLGLVLLVWTLLSSGFAELGVIPSPLDVAVKIWQDRASHQANIAVTLREAMVGYAWGNVTAILLGMLFVRVPAAERVLLRLAIASYCVPLVAIAPILVVVLPGDAPKEALAALSVFFTTLVATVVGLRSSDATSVDLVYACGGSTWQTLRLVRIRAALPSLFAGLRIAAPAALLGAIIGEYLGASRGLGVALVQAQSSFEVERTWGIALVISALAGLLYAATAVVARLLTPWAGTQLDVGNGAGDVAAGRDGRFSRALEAAGFLLLSVAVTLAGWYALLRLFDLNGYFAKTPSDVLRYVVSDPDAATHRHELWLALKVTMVDAAVGYLVGTVAAVVMAVAVVTVRAAEQTLMPVAIVLRSVPLVAMAPLIALVFGRGLVGVTVVVALVVFFPTLVNLSVGLRAAPLPVCELISSLGGSRFHMVTKVRLQYALPALFASARIAVPAALGGATLAEWLATGDGLGNLLVISYSNSRFGTLWAGAVLIVVVSVGLYALISAIERPVLRRYTPHYSTR